MTDESQNAPAKAAEKATAGDCGCEDCQEQANTPKKRGGCTTCKGAKEFKPSFANLVHDHISAAGRAIGASGRPVPQLERKPGQWRSVPKVDPVDPDVARRYIESRPLPTNIYVPPQKMEGENLKSLAGGAASNTVGGPVSIVELSRSLKSNVDLIYEWVFNNIDVLPTHGVHKGAVGAIIDGFGNSFDQADLMIKLLRQAGYTANYQYGTLRMNAAQATAWLGVVDIATAAAFLGWTGVPAAQVNVSGVDYVEFSHCWVLCNISGTNYVFDPTVKTYTTKAGINLATAMGFNATTFMNRARTGATITADYVQNLNRANIRSDLDTMTMNLVNWIKTNNHGAGMDDIIGGRTINQYDASTPLRQTAHPLLKPSSTITTWTSIPQAYKATMRLVHDGVDITFNTEDLAGKRLTMFFNGSNEAEFRLDGTLVATSNPQGVGTWYDILIDVQHAYSSNAWDLPVYQTTWQGNSYLIANSWGNMATSAVNFHSQRIQELGANNEPTTSEQFIGETMAQMSKALDTMSCRIFNIINQFSQNVTVLHHQCGLIGYDSTMFLDYGNVEWSSVPLNGASNNWIPNDVAAALHGVALESQIVREIQTCLGVSSTPLIDGPHASGQRIYDAKTANWLTNVKPNLTNYAPGDLTNIENWYITPGNRVAMTADGLNTIGSWTGYGFNVMPGAGTYGIIGGGLKGGKASMAMSPYTLTYPIRILNYDVFYVSGWPPPDCDDVTAFYNPGICLEVNYNPFGTACECAVPAGLIGINGYYVPGGGNGVGGGGGGGLQMSGAVTSAEPIDMANGAYLLDSTDITVGSSIGLAFSRSYSSAARNQHGLLGRGWRHNYQIYAHIDTSGLMSLGEQTVIGAAGSIVEAFVTYQLQTDLTQPFDKYVTCVIANQWFIDNLSHNIVTLQAGHQSKTFVKLPDGTYANPVGDNGTLSIVSGKYRYTSLSGQVLNFNSFGHIETMVDPAGVTITCSYDSFTNLLSVTNGLGRTLTFSYTDHRISSVSDGNGRSVNYTVDNLQNLTTVVDPNGKSWTYEYDQPGRMTKHYKPANPTTAIVTNVYDSLSRIKQQKDYQLNAWDYYFAGSRSEEVNPNGKGSVVYWGNMGTVLKAINQVGKKTTSEYDGQRRLTKTTAPEGNAVQFVYDGKHRVTQTTAKAKPASGLVDIVTSTTYDATWGKVKTTTDNMGRVTTYNYDPANGNLLSVVSPSVTGLGSSTMSMTYNARGQVLTVTSPDGIVGKNTYDTSTEKLTSSVADFGVGRLNLTVNFGYDSVGNLTSVQDPRGNTANVSYDVLRRVTQTTAPSPFSYVTKFTFDDNGNTTKVERQTSDPLNPWQTSQATYSADNKVLTATDPQGNVTTMTFDTLQRLWKVTDAASRVVERFYDDANRISSIKDPSGTTAVTYTYRDNGGLSTIKDARNYTTTYTVDGHDRADKTTYPDSTYEQVTSRDGNSNPLTVVTRSGATVTLTYDELNRVKTKAPASQPTVTTVYDIAGRVVTVSTPVVAGDPSSGTFTSFYDTAGRFYKEQYPDTLAVTHELDANGNVTKTTYPDGYYVQRVFDQLNRLTDIKLNGAGTSAVQFEYDALSRRTKLTYENGCSTRYGFEVDNDMNLLYLNFVGSSVGFNYGFDSVNQMSLQGMTDPANFRWTPGSPATTTYATANNINQYGTVGGTSFTYSTDGSLTNDGVNKYEYNTERMLTRVRNAGTNAIIADYLYDPGRRQRQKNVGGTKTNYYYAGWQRLADYDGTTNTLQTRYVYGTGLDEVLISVASGGTKTYFHANHQGSVVATTNGSGAVTSTYKYSPFGESSSMSGTSHGYTGQRFDPETGLYYYKMRQYSPRFGRFLQADPIGYAAGMNLYAYVSNNPLNLVDSIGLMGAIPDAIYSELMELKRLWLNDPAHWEQGAAGTGDGKWKLGTPTSKGTVNVDFSNPIILMSHLEALPGETSTQSEGFSFFLKPTSSQIGDYANADSFGKAFDDMGLEAASQMWTIVDNGDIFLYEGKWLTTMDIQMGHEYWFKASEGYSSAHPSNDPYPSPGWTPTPKPASTSRSNYNRIAYVSGLVTYWNEYTWDGNYVRTFSFYDNAGNYIGQSGSSTSSGGNNNPAGQPFGNGSSASK